ncbi:uncharacterized protein [Blastocystis hominis]|uniref:Ras-related protein Rab-1 n=1 Tax=Blastocystis hominis TaxID=12968 RepID=D8LV88_BLAHO|nr:uncharacterized protein [Blastocystis hominis]CBK19727.2 unnamed protein product [Blastocystis hominis]|eukprot:XP_012893775.1 uncharacterized protein [Blastocystis hominis]
MAANKKNFDMQIKLLMIGDSGVGKTCLLMQYASKTFIKTFITTIGIDFKIKTVNVLGKTVKLQIWDTAGQERFRTITTSYVRGSEGILLVYDVTDRNSFESISSWMEQISQHADSSVNKILIGNKCDLEAQRAVSTEEGRKLAERFGIPFAETSAQTNQNVDEAFMTLAEAVVKRKNDEAGSLEYKTEKAETVKISNAGKKEGKKGGCCK